MKTKEPKTRTLKWDPKGPDVWVAEPSLDESWIIRLEDDMYELFDAHRRLAVGSFLQLKNAKQAAELITFG